MRVIIPFKIIFILSVLLIPKKSFSQDIADASTEISGIIRQGNDSITVENSLEDLNLYKRPKPTPPWFVRRFKLTAGAFFPVNNTKIEIGNSDGSKGTEIDFEDDLGFKKSTITFLGNFQWRASRRSRFDLGYFHLDRTTSRTLQKTIEFGDHTYPVNATVSSYFKVDIYQFSYGYAFLLGPKYELGLQIGIHTLGTGVGINLIGETAGVGYNDKFDFTAPLPDIGIWGGYAFTDKLALNGNVNYFSIKVNDFTGKIVSYNLSFMYQVIPDLSLALGYTGMNFTVDVVKTRMEGFLKWGYNGPTITASYSFGKRKPFETPQ